MRTRSALSCEVFCKTSSPVAEDRIQIALDEELSNEVSTGLVGTRERNHLITERLQMRRECFANESSGAGNHNSHCFILSFLAVFAELM